jgi:RNA polymerase sigma-70 factor (ECF subfamily)
LLDDLDVAELVMRARQRDAAAFAALIERFEKAALSAAWAILRDADRAADAVQEAFLRAWEELPGLKDAARFGGWLMQIVRHAAIDVRRKIRPTARIFPEIPARSLGPALQAEQRDRDRQVKQALDLLDETTREAILLRYYEGMPTKEIAEVLEMSPAAVDMRLSRGRALLRESLGELLQESPPPHRRRTGDSYDA